MNVVYKYDLNIGISKIGMPKDARVLKVDNQRENLVMWAEVSDQEPNVARTFQVYGTGHPLIDDPQYERVYVGTAQLHDGQFVAHVYEIKLRTN